MPRAATADRRSPVAGSRTVRSMRNAWAAWGNRPPRAGRTCKVRVSARPWPASVSVPSVSVPSVSVPSVSVPSVSVPSVSVPSVSVPSVSVPSVSVPSVSVPSVSVPSVSVPSVSRCRIEPHLDQARRLRRRGPASAPASALEGRPRTPGHTGRDTQIMSALAARRPGSTQPPSSSPDCPSRGHHVRARFARRMRSAFRRPLTGSRSSGHGSGQEDGGESRGRHQATADGRIGHLAAMRSRMTRGRQDHQHWSRDQPGRAIRVILASWPGQGHRRVGRDPGERAAPS